MRYLIIMLCFCPGINFAQHQLEADIRYVWAESGLSMRSEGRADADRTGVVPYGEAVQLTGKFGLASKVTALPAVTYDWGDEEAIKGEAYVMDEPYLEVVHGRDTGYVYRGYLSHYPPPGTTTPTRLNPTETWLIQLCGVPDTILYGNEPLEYVRFQSVLHYRNGVVTTYREHEGGGGTLFTFPVGSLNEGYLIAARLMGVTYGVTDKEDIMADPDYLPELLTIEEDGSLSFSGDMSETRIYMVGGMLFIYSAGWC